MSAQPYNGDEKLVFAIDCGTTMSAVSFVHLMHGVAPQVRVVKRWPFQEEATANCKFPTVVRYSSAGAVVAVGAAALEQDENDQSSSLARWFKLLLHPRAMRDEYAIAAPPLPDSVTLEKVYTDFLRYTFDHARTYFQTITLDGNLLWERLGGSFELVFAIPNGWEEAQQAFIRTRVVEAGILPAGFAQNRLTFVPEAEASVHFAIENMNVAHILQAGAVFGVLDAGGSTVDTTIYRCEAIAPRLRLVEVTASECVQAGSVFVDRAFETSIRTLLAGSRFGTNEHIEQILKIFESRTKRRFTNDDDDVNIKFGHNADNDQPRRIRRGNLTVPSNVMRAAYQGPVAAITASICRILQRSPVPCETFLLVGGFAESKYLQAALQDGLTYRGLKFVTSDEPATKAAAEGACSWRVKQYVAARAARCTYGTTVYRFYNPLSSVHIQRRHLIFVDAAGEEGIPGFLDILVPKNTVIEATNATSVPYMRRYAYEPMNLGEETVVLLVSDVVNPGPWADDLNGNLENGLRYACTLRANLSGLNGSVERRVGRGGQVYWEVNYKVEIYFGGTSLTAAIVWVENGINKKGDVAIIPNSLV